MPGERPEVQRRDLPAVRRLTVPRGGLALASVRAAAV